MEQESRAAAGITREDLVKRTGLGSAGCAGARRGARCGISVNEHADAANTIKIGFISPRTGPLAGFGEPDPYVLDLARKALANGLNDRRQDLRGQDHRQGHAVRPGRARASSRRT